jgi:hypothetical protein
MATLVSDYHVYARLGGAWVEITGDIVSAISASWGINGIGPTDRIASTGSMRFTLRNTTLKYLPGSATAHVDWRKGAAVIFTIEYDGMTHTRYRGLIDTIKPRLPIGSDGTVEVTVLDWMDIAARAPIINPTILTEKMSGEAVEEILPYAPIQPRAALIDAGASEFPSIFDNTRSGSAVFSELNRVALSELGYVYLRKDPEHGETLVFEQYGERHGLRTTTQIPIPLASSEELTTETAEVLLTEDGEDILLNQVQAVTLDNEIADATMAYGEHMINRMTMRVYPKRVDTSVQVLWRLDAAVRLASGETLEIRGRYTDPAGGGTQVNGVNMVTPVVTTDYLMNTRKDGAGTNITTDLSITVVYGAEGPTYTLVNTGNRVGWVTRLQARGYGVYTYDTVEATIEDATSVVAYGYQSADLSQQYQQDPAWGIIEAHRAVEEGAEPRLYLTRVRMNPNVEPDVLNLLLYADVGDLVHIKFDKVGIDGLYYIQAVEVTMKVGCIMEVVWRVVGALTILSGLTGIGVEIRAGSQDGINYGYVPGVFGVPERTMAARIKPTALATVNAMLIGGPMADSGGTIMYLRATTTGTDNQVRFYSNLYNVAPGVWEADTLLDLDTWYTVVISYRPQTIADVPVIYIDGVADTVTELHPCLGDPLEEVGNMVIGNQKTATIDYGWPFAGQIADFRVWDRILTASEAAAYHNGEDIADGLVFQSPMVRTNELSRFIDQPLSGRKVLDGARGVVGSVNGDPTGRTAP